MTQDPVAGTPSPWRCPELIERLDKFENTVLREFRVWGVYFESRFRANEILIGGFNERLVPLEERAGDVERRKDV